MASLRSEGSFTAGALVDRASHRCLDWPGKTVRLMRDSVEDTIQRPVGTRVSLGELWHENSKIWPLMLSELAASRLDADSFRLDYVRRRATESSDSGPPLTVDGHTRALLQVLGTTVRPSLFYAVELRMAHAGKLAGHEPLTGVLRLMKRLSLGDRERIAVSLQLLPGPAPDPDSLLVFVLGSFARNEVLYGRRGHRRTVLEAGQVTEGVISAASRAGRFSRAVYEFGDRELDAVVEADGVEQATLAVVEVARP